MQDIHVVCYESRKLKYHEKNYATHELELAAIVHALKMWRHYLMGRRFQLRTDHCGQEYLFDQPTLNVRQARWLELLCEFDFEIKHIKGKENKVADALNRKVQEMHVASISIFQIVLLKMNCMHRSRTSCSSKALKRSKRDTNWKNMEFLLIRTKYIFQIQNI